MTDSTVFTGRVVPIEMGTIRVGGSGRPVPIVTSASSTTSTDVKPRITLTPQPRSPFGRRIEAAQTGNAMEGARNSRKVLDLSESHDRTIRRTPAVHVHATRQASRRTPLSDAVLRVHDAREPRASKEGIHERMMKRPRPSSSPTRFHVHDTMKADTTATAPPPTTNLARNDENAKHIERLTHRPVKRRQEMDRGHPSYHVSLSGSNKSDSTHLVQPDMQSGWRAIDASIDHIYQDVSIDVVQQHLLLHSDMNGRKRKAVERERLLAAASEIQKQKRMCSQRMEELQRRKLEIQRLSADIRDQNKRKVRRHEDTASDHTPSRPTTSRQQVKDSDVNAIPSRKPMVPRLSRLGVPDKKMKKSKKPRPAQSQPSSVNDDLVEKGGRPQSPQENQQASDSTHVMSAFAGTDITADIVGAEERALDESTSPIHQPPTRKLTWKKKDERKNQGEAQATEIPRVSNEQLERRAIAREYIALQKRSRSLAQHQQRERERIEKERRQTELQRLEQARLQELQESKQRKKRSTLKRGPGQQKGKDRNRASESLLMATDSPSKTIHCDEDSRFSNLENEGLLGNISNANELASMSSNRSQNEGATYRTIQSEPSSDDSLREQYKLLKLHQLKEHTRLLSLKLSQLMEKQAELPIHTPAQIPTHESTAQTPEAETRPNQGDVSLSAVEGDSDSLDCSSASSSDSDSLRAEQSRSTQSTPSKPEHRAHSIDSSQLLSAKFHLASSIELDFGSIGVQNLHVAWEDEDELTQAQQGFINSDRFEILSSSSSSSDGKNDELFSPRLVDESVDTYKERLQANHIDQSQDESEASVTKPSRKKTSNNVEFFYTQGNRSFQSEQSKPQLDAHRVSMRRQVAEERLLAMIRETDDNLSVIDREAKRRFRMQQERMKRKEEAIEMKNRSDALATLRETFAQHMMASPDRRSVASVDGAESDMGETYQDHMNVTHLEGSRDEVTAPVLADSKQRSIQPPSQVFWNELVAGDKHEPEASRRLPTIEVDTSELIAQRNCAAEAAESDRPRIYSPRTLANQLMAAVELHEAVHQAHAQLAMIEKTHLVEQAQQDALRIASAFQSELESTIVTHQLAADHAELEKKFDDDLRIVMHKVEEVQNSERDEFKREQERIQQELRLASQREQSMQTESPPRTDIGTNAKLQVDAAVMASLQEHVDVGIQYDDSLLEQSPEASERVNDAVASVLKAHGFEDASERYDEETFEESEVQHLAKTTHVELAEDKPSVDSSSDENIRESVTSQGEVQGNEVEQVEDESIDEDGYSTKSDVNDSVKSSVHSDQPSEDRSQDYADSRAPSTPIQSRGTESFAEYDEDFENSVNADVVEGASTDQDYDEIEDMGTEASNNEESAEIGSSDIPDDATPNERAPETTALKRDSVKAEIMDHRTTAFADDMMGARIALHGDPVIPSVSNIPNDVVESYIAQLKTRKESEEALLSIRLVALEARINQDLAVLTNEIQSLGDANRDNRRYQELMLRKEALRMAFTSEKASIESLKAAAAAKYYQDLLAFQTISSTSTTPAVSFPHITGSIAISPPNPHTTLTPSHRLAPVATSPVTDRSASPEVSEDYGDEGFASVTEKDDIVADDSASDDAYSEGVNGADDVQDTSTRSADIEESAIAESDGGYGDDFASISEARSAHSGDQDNGLESNDTGSVKDDIIDLKQDNLLTVDAELNTDEDDPDEDDSEKYAEDDFASVSDAAAIQQSASVPGEDHDDDIASVQDDVIESTAEPSVASEEEGLTPANDYEEDDFEEKDASTGGIEAASSMVSHSDDSSTTKLLVAEVEHLRQNRPADTAESEKAHSKLQKKKEAALELIRAKEAMISQQTQLIRCEEERKQIDEIAQLALGVNVVAEVTRVKEAIKQELRSEMEQLKAAYPGLIPPISATNAHAGETKERNATVYMAEPVPEQHSSVAAKVDDGEDYEIDSFEHEDARSSSIASVEHIDEATYHSEDDAPVDADEIEENASEVPSKSEGSVEDEAPVEESGHMLEVASADYDDDAFEDVQSTPSSTVADSDRHLPLSVGEDVRNVNEDAHTTREVPEDEHEMNDEYSDDDDFESASKSSVRSKSSDSHANDVLPSSVPAADNSATSIISQCELDAALAETVSALNQPPTHVTSTEETQLLRPLEESVLALTTSDDDPISRSIEEQTKRLTELKAMIEQRKSDIVRVQRQLRVEKKKEHLREEENALWAEMEVLEHRLISDERILELSIQRNRLESVQLEARHETFLRPRIVEVDLLAEFDVVEAAEPPNPPVQKKESEVQAQLAPQSAVAEVATNDEGDLLLAYNYVEDAESASHERTERVVASGAAIVDDVGVAEVHRGDVVDETRTPLPVVTVDSTPDTLNVCGGLDSRSDVQPDEDLLSGFDVVESVEPIVELTAVASDDLLDGYDHVECAEPISASEVDLTKCTDEEPSSDPVGVSREEDLVARSASEDELETPCGSSQLEDFGGVTDRIDTMDTEAPIDDLGCEDDHISLSAEPPGDSEEPQSVEADVATATTETKQSKRSEVNSVDTPYVEDSTPELLPGAIGRLADGLFDDLMKEMNEDVSTSIRKLLFHRSQHDVGAAMAQDTETQDGDGNRNSEPIEEKSELESPRPAAAEELDRHQVAVYSEHLTDSIADKLLERLLLEAVRDHLAADQRLELRSLSQSLEDVDHGLDSPIDRAHSKVLIARSIEDWIDSKIQTITIDHCRPQVMGDVAQVAGEQRAWIDALRHLSVESFAQLARDSRFLTRSVEEQTRELREAVRSSVQLLQARRHEAQDELDRFARQVCQDEGPDVDQNDLDLFQSRHRTSVRPLLAHNRNAVLTLAATTHPTQRVVTPRRRRLSSNVRTTHGFISELLLEEESRLADRMTTLLMKDLLAQTIGAPSQQR